MSTAPPAIAVSDLAHAYPGRAGPVPALRGLTLAVAPGEFFGLFGPNGAGKTTFIRILATLVTPTAGRARVLGLDVAAQPAQVRARIGLVSSNENSFYGRLTARQNLEFFAGLQGLRPSAARLRAAELLDVFGLRAAADAPAQTFSTGMRQRLNVARALLHDPPVIFLDEPTKGLDVLAAANLRALLKDELVGRRGKTVLLTTHDLAEMEQLCGRVAILEAGRLRAAGAPADLIREASASVIYRLELAEPAPALAGQLAGLPAVAAVTAVSATILELTLRGAPGRELWAALAAADVPVQRFAPKDDGLVTVLKQAQPA
ncbi:MAG: ABC transporter ATP-binding protein [Anaerolineales bacterium]|nr:ABC transporter ATP-binding protein [Anaerolineales bacterium]